MNAYAEARRAAKVDRLVGAVAAIAVRTGTPMQVVRDEWREIALYARAGSPECWAALHTLEGVARLKHGLHEGTSLDLFIDSLDMPVSAVAA